MNRATFPPELTSRTQWVTWSFDGNPDPKTGKRKKVLKNPATGKNAQTNNAQTWGTFDQAVNALATYRHEGLGFVFTNSDPYVGIDLDNCIHPDGSYSQLAQSVLATCQSYAEISPSGTGIHLIVRGAIPKAIKTSGIEIYATGRYFTMTGQSLPDRSPQSMSDEQPLLDVLSSLYAPQAPTFAPSQTTTSGAAVGDAYPARWVEVVVNHKISTITQTMARATHGIKHSTRLAMGELAGGLLAWLDSIGYSYLADDQQLAQAIFDANPPQANARSEAKAIVDAIQHGRLSPLVIPPPPPSQPAVPPPPMPAYQPPTGMQTVTVNERYLSGIGILTKITAIQSPLGTGKTHAIAHVIPDTASVLVITHRRSLGRYLAQRFTTAYYEDCQTTITQESRLTICLDSLHKLDLATQHFDYVVIDESEQVFTHLTGNTIEPIKREHTLVKLESVITKALHTIVMDAYLGTITLNMIGRVLAPSAITLLTNTYQPADKRVYKYTSRDDCMIALHGALDHGEALYVSMNSKEQVKTVETRLKSAYPDLKIMAVHGDNSDNPDVQHFITNINTEVVNYDVVIASPAIVSGVSIDVLHFASTFVFAEARITSHTDVLQQAARVRTTKTQAIHCWIAPQTYHKQTDTLILKQWAIENYQQTGVFVNARTAPPTAYDDRYLDLWCDIHAFQHGSTNHLAARVYAGFEALGYDVVNASTATPDERRTMRGVMRDAKNTMIEGEYTATLDAEILDHADYDAIKDKIGLSDDERYAKAQYELRSFYELDQPANISLDLYKKDMHGYRQQVRNFAHILDLDVATYEDERQHTNGYLRADLSHNTIAAMLRCEVLAQLVTPEDVCLLKENSGVGSLNLDALHTWLAIPDNTQRIERVLGAVVDASSPQKVASFVTNFLHSLGLKREKVKQTASGKREYTINVASLNEVHAYATRYIARKRYDMDYDAFISQPTNQVTNQVTMSPSQPSQTAIPVQPVNQQVQSGNPLADLEVVVMATRAYNDGQLRAYCRETGHDFDLLFDFCWSEDLRTSSYA